MLLDLDRFKVVNDTLGHAVGDRVLRIVAHRLAHSVRPGDVVAFNHNLMHASFGGSGWRRMFTMNFCARCQTPEEERELRQFINAQARFWIDQLHSDVMRRTASPQRMRHLRQVMEQEGDLPALAAKARAEMKESSRG